MAVLNRVYSPLRTQFSMDVVEGTLTQEYDANNKIYTPDRRIRPTAVLPVCSITDPSGMIEDGIVNRYITDIKWYENGNKDSNVISPTSIHYKIDYSSDTNNRGRITIYKNVNSDNPIALFFTANYADIVNGKVRRKVSFWGTVVLSSSVSASSPIVIKTETLRGTKYNPLSNLKYMTLSADLYSGNTIIPAAFWWYKKENGQENLITDYVGHNLRELQVPSSSLKIGSLNNYVCKVQDCRQNLTDVRNEYLQEELDKIADYPRNMLAKQYFLDLNNEVQPGVVTEGEDADGKYICVPNPATLRTYVGADKFGDLFSGKISFKENTVYVVRIKGKTIMTGEGNATGFMLTIVYTDGKYRTYPISGKDAISEIVFSTESGKTVSHISCTYGNNYPTYIYDIQITEEYNYNLLEGNTEEVVVTASTGNSNSYKKIKISKALSVGKKITVKVDGMENLAGEATEYSVNLMQGTEIITTGEKLKSSYKTHVFTINDKYDPNGEPAYLILYAGKTLETAGNSVKYKNVQLLEGEYAWNVLGEDVEEVTIVGESINSYKSIEIKDPIQAGGKYTLDIGEIIKVEGSTEEYTVQMYQFGAVNSSIATPSGVITQNQKSITFTVNSKYNPELKVHLVLYAGVLNNTSGNTVQYKNIRLLQGETVLPSMPDYTPHFVPSAPDIEVASEAIQLPEGYRPDVQGKTINHEFALTSEMPAYNVKVVTPYGDDSDVISIPNNVKLFPAWIQVDVAGIGTLDNPEKYFSADWGNGLKGMNVLLDADDIGLGVQEVEPDVVEGMEHVKYGLAGYFAAPTSNLEKIETGTRLVVECDLSHTTASRPISIRKNKYGFYITIDANKKVLIYIVFNDLSYRANGLFEPSNPMLIDIRMGDTSDESSVIINGITYKFNSVGLNLGFTSDDAFYIYRELRTSLIEIYKDDTLLHKWDFEGSTSAERLSDKAETENKISIVMGDGSEFIPV